MTKCGAPNWIVADIHPHSPSPPRANFGAQMPLWRPTSPAKAVGGMGHHSACQKIQGGLLRTPPPNIRSAGSCKARGWLQSCNTYPALLPFPANQKNKRVQVCRAIFGIVFFGAWAAAVVPGPCFVFVLVFRLFVCPVFPFLVFCDCS